jgi:hypothetical protein
MTDELWKYYTKLNKPVTVGKMAHICNPSYLGGRDQEDVVWDQPGQKVRPLCQKEDGCGGALLSSHLHER